MYNIAICDDDPLFRERLQKLIDEQADKLHLLPQLQITPFDSGDELIKYTAENLDLIFLDMEMPGNDGFQTAQILNATGREFILAFCTGVRKPRPEYFDAHPFCYIMKQYSDEQISQTLYNLLEEIQRKKNSKQIRIIGNGESSFLPINEILYIDKSKRGSIVHISDALIQKGVKPELIADQHLSSFLNALEADGFARAHDSYIVNLGQIINVTENRLIFSNGHDLAISRTYKSSFHEAYTAYCGRKYRRRQQWDN